MNIDANDIPKLILEYTTPNAVPLNYDSTTIEIHGHNVTTYAAKNIPFIN